MMRFIRGVFDSVGIWIAIFFCVAVILTQTGCTGVAVVQDKIGEGVNSYCRMSYPERQAIRTQVNADTAPNRIKVECYGDPENPAYISPDDPPVNKPEAKP